MSDWSIGSGTWASHDGPVLGESHTAVMAVYRELQHPKTRWVTIGVILGSWLNAYSWMLTFWF